MKQEDKKLLLKDLCARLPYGVKVQVYNHWRSEYEYETLTLKNYHDLIDTFCVEDIKPYLFPLSSMTDEQKQKYCSLVWFDGLSAGWNRDDAVILNEVEILIDFYHKNHLDYRGLIPMGLANDATRLNIY